MRLEITQVGTRNRISGGAAMRRGHLPIEIRDMHSIVDLETRTRLNPVGDVHLGDHVWLGMRAVVLKGVEIGPGSVIGAGAVVSRSIPANCIAVGVPARVVRRNITWHRSSAELAAQAAGELDIETPPRD